MVIVSCAPFALHFSPKRCWSHLISWITCVLRTETVTNRYVNSRLADVMWLFDLLTDRLTPSVTDRLLIMYGILLRQLFTARCYASAVLAMALCLSVRPSVTSRCSTKTAKHRITQTTPHDTPGSLVFCCQRSPRNSTGVTPYEGAECRWDGQNRRLSTNSRLYLQNGKR